ncbi:MAG TPA: hypothetical protein VF622_04435 [Segetibacter sp.]|jgi:hypothetical protein
MFKTFAVSVLLLSTNILLAQRIMPLDFLRSKLQLKAPVSYDSSRTYFQLFTKDGLHYLNPVYQLILNEEKMKVAMGERNFYDNASQSISFSGDYQTSNSLTKRAGDTLTSKAKREIEDLIHHYKNGRHVDAKKFLLRKAEAYQIMMINEAHHNPSHRAFTFSLLEDLYNKGFKYLAMETFFNSPNSTLNKITSLTGTYTLEPIGGELARYALKLGYKLIAYEDTAYSANHTSTQRDSVQARNLYKVLQKDNTAKIVVHAGFAHITKSAFGDYTPLGKALYNLTGIPYLSIDQTEYSEGIRYVFGRTKYDHYVKEYNVKKPVIALKGNTDYSLFDTVMYDFNVIHPTTKYKEQRPDWISLSGYRKKYIIKKELIPTNTFLVQAYYHGELIDNKMENLVPADQTYYKTDKGTYALYLSKDKYTLVLRDAYYNVIKTRMISIK